MEISPTSMSTIKPLRSVSYSPAEKIANAQETRKAFRDFVGQTFFGQMFKSMRSTQGKPAYFHGGQTEEIFRSQLDQTMAEHMTEASADQIADPMFKRQFPQQARLLAGFEKEQASKLRLSDLAMLPRR